MNVEAKFGFKDSLATAVILAAMLVFILAGIVSRVDMPPLPLRFSQLIGSAAVVENKTPAVHAAMPATQQMAPIVVSAPRLPVLQLETIVVTAPRLVTPAIAAAADTNAARVESNTSL